MTDSRIFAAIILMGIAAVAGKLLDLWRWHVDEETLEVQPVVMDTASNGGVRASAR